MPEHIPADAPTKVLFAKSARNLADADLDAVAIIYPDRDSWNDYGRNFFAKLQLRPEGEETIQFHIRIMFEGFLRSENAFDELYAREGDVFSIDRVNTPFVSLIPDIENYKKLIEALGFERGVSVLRKLHDAVVVRTEGSNEDGIRLAASEDFHFGALRNSGAYTALRRGGRYFRADPIPELDDAAQGFAFSARLKSADNPYTLAFNFDREGIFRDRAGVLIGRNGVGKTQLLKAVIDGLHSDHPEDFSRPHFFPAFRPARVLVFSSVPTDPFPRSIGAWHGIDYEYFAVNALREDGADPLLEALVACKKGEDADVFGEGRDESRLDVIKGALEAIGLWSRLYLPLRPRVPGDVLNHVLEIDGGSYFWIGRGLSEGDLIRLVNQIDWTRSPVVLDNNVRPRELSSGEYAMLRFAAQAAAAIDQGSLLLFDEPETHLHPNFISDLMEILDNLLQSTRSVAIIATHSAYVVRETPRDRVNILTLDDREIRIDRPRMQTFGATIDSISQFIFGDTNMSHRYQKTLARWAETVGSERGIEGVIAEFGSELNPESLSFIARQLNSPSAVESEAD